MQSRIQIAADHPCFAGHFPKFPVLPGALLLDETLRAVEQARGLDLTQWHIASAKFLDVVRPGDCLRVQHEAVSAELIRFTVHVENRKVASGTLRSAARNAGT